MFRSSLLGFALVWGMVFTSQLVSAESSSPRPPVFDHAHLQWARVLKSHVTVRGPVSEVAYGKLHGDPATLDEYLQTLSAVGKDEFGRFSREEQLSFLINAYNAFTMKLIVDHYPVNSIKEIGGLFSSPWKKKLFTLLGEKRHLDSVEHGMIRRDPKAYRDLEESLRSVLKDFNEPRVHFALNCASKGCPALRGEPYLPSHLGKQLEDATKSFLQDSARNVFDASRSALRLSSIFKWYGEDFVKASGSVQGFVAPRMARNSTDEAKIKAAKMTFLDYDWSLNGK